MRRRIAAVGPLASESSSHRGPFLEDFRNLTATVAKYSLVRARQNPCAAGTGTVFSQTLLRNKLAGCASYDHVGHIIMNPAFRTASVLLLFITTIARGEPYLPSITNGNVAVLLNPVATGMAAPDYAISPPGDTNRLFVVEQNGLLRIIQNGTLLPGSALDIQSRVQPPLNAGNPNDERGFLGLAFHSGFTNPASPGFRTLYTYNSELIPTATTPTYIAPNGATNNYKNVVNEWKISITNNNVVDPSSRRE